MPTPARPGIPTPRECVSDTCRSGRIIHDQAVTLGDRGWPGCCVIAQVSLPVSQWVSWTGKRFSAVTGLCESPCRFGAVLGSAPCPCGAHFI